MIKIKILVLFLTTFLSIHAFSQDREVIGVVVSNDGLPLPGVNIIVKGTTQGTITDVEGKYKLKVSEGTTLVFSAVGMKPYEAVVGTKSVIDANLEEDVKQLDEVVVNAIGEKRSKDKLGIAIPVVSGKSISESGETGLINGLAGKADGLIITRNGGDPGAGSYIQIRGQSTIAGSVQPLIVIDGMPMFNSNLSNNYGTGGVTSSSANGNGVSGVQQQSRMNDINPADIASVEILKGASAAALWGSRAANGVIIITTKKGSNTNGKLQVSYTGSISFDQVNKMPKLQTLFGQGKDGKFSTAESASFGDLISTRSGGADTYSGTDYVEFPDGTRRYAIASGTDTNVHGGKNSRDVFDHTSDIYGIGKTSENAISLSGGSEKNQILVSYANTDQKGIVKMNSDYKKNVLRVNVQSLLTSKVSANINMNYSNVRSNRAQQGSNRSGLLLGMLRTPPDFDNSKWIGTAYSADGIPTFGKQITYRNPIGAAANPGYDNPLWTMNKNNSYSAVNRFIGNVDLKYDWTDWLMLKVNSGLDNYSDHRTDFFNAQTAQLLGGSYTDQYIYESQWNTNLFAVGNKKFSDNFAGTATVGFNYNAIQYNNVGASVTNFTIPDAPPSLSNVPAANRSPFNDATTTKTSAGFFELNGDFYNQLFITVTGRAETASTFGPQAQSLFFYPSVSLAWQFTKLLPKNDLLTFGKLRAAYGVVGKQPDAYLNLTKYVEQTASVQWWGPKLAGSAYGDGGYAVSTMVGNPEIKPERKYEFEIGADLRFFKDRVTLSATAYQNKTTDIILSTQVAPSAGFNSRTGNAGVLENKGLEFNLGVDWIKRPEGISWSSNFIWSTYRNKVLDLAGAQYVFLGGFQTSGAVKGEPLGVLLGRSWETDEHGKYVLTQYGFPQVAANLSIMGNPNPDFRTSLGNNVNFKNFNLSFLFEASIGGKMWNGTKGTRFNIGTAEETAYLTTVSAAEAATLKTADGKTVATASRRIIKNDDGSYTFRGTIEDFGGGQVAVDENFYNNAGGGFSVSKPFVESATWTRLREATLSYTLNSKNFQALSKIRSMTLAVTGRNLLLWTKYSGIDPDTNLTGSSNERGIDYSQNPNTRSIILRLSLNF